jgi:hydroxymethylpyrimidine/phosphomethylpyrimidine kinase
MHTALTIAGSDSGGGAGIQADLKTFAAHGVYGMSALTAVTAQNTLGVVSWMALPPAIVRAQVDAVIGDIGADAVKIGMLGNAPIVETVAAAVRELDLQNVVLDPVMVAKGGNPLVEPPAVDAIRRALVPLALVVTPNAPEAAVLTGISVRSLRDVHDAGHRILEMGARVVLIKGGHIEGAESIDVAFTPGETFELRGPRINTTSTHGTGCTLSSAIAANLALGIAVREALQRAREYVEGAIRQAPGLGGGHGPLNHFWRERGLSPFPYSADDAHSHE